eukprot:3114649-Amphidinium_carterae.1
MNDFKNDFDRQAIKHGGMGWTDIYCERRCFDADLCVDSSYGTSGAYWCILGRTSGAEVRAFFGSSSPPVETGYEVATNCVEGLQAGSFTTTCLSIVRLLILEHFVHLEDGPVVQVFFIPSSKHDHQMFTLHCSTEHMLDLTCVLEKWKEPSARTLVCEEAGLLGPAHQVPNYCK